MFFSLGFEPNATWSKLWDDPGKACVTNIKAEKSKQFCYKCYIIVYSAYDSEVEMLNNRKVICHEYVLKKHAKSKKNLPTPLSKCVILK